MSGAIGQQYEAVPIRLQVTLGNTPPVAPIDYNTGAQPRFYRGGCVALQLGAFDATGTPFDITNWQQVQAILAPAYGSPWTNWAKTIPQSGIQAITVAEWQSGGGQNANFLLGPGDTDLGLNGQAELDYWLTIVVTTTNGNVLIISAGPVTCFSAGSFLPPAPSPSGPGLPSRNAQENDAGDFSITPLSQFHIEEVTIGGIARTSNCLIGTTNVADGARLLIAWTLTATPGITVQLRTSIITAAIIPPNITTGDTLNGVTEFYFNKTAGVWKPMIYKFPAP